MVENMEKALQEERQPDPVILELDPELAVPDESMEGEAGWRLCVSRSQDR